MILSFLDLALFALKLYIKTIETLQSLQIL